jgi:hypothetical protein
VRFAGVRPPTEHYQAIAELLGAQVDYGDWPPFVELSEDRGMWLAIIDDGTTLTFNHMMSEPPGGGIGTKVMEAIKSHLDSTGRAVRFRDVIAPDFFDRFDWLTAEETSERYEGRDIVDYRRRLRAGR